MSFFRTTSAVVDNVIELSGIFDTALKTPINTLCNYLNFKYLSVGESKVLFSNILFADKKSDFLHAIICF